MSGPSAPLPDRIESLLSQPQYANHYAGDAANADGSLTVYATPGGESDIRAALASLAPPSASTYTVQTAAHSLAQLADLTSQIAADKNQIAAQGIRTIDFGPDPTTNTVSVSVLTDAAAARSYLEAHYGGSGWISVTQRSSSDLMHRTANRYYDTPPFYNGDRIFVDDNHNYKCTDGFALNIGSGTQGVTAGHCGGSSIYTNFDSNYFMGAITARHFTDGGDDFETFNCYCASPVWYEGPSIGRNQGYVHYLAAGWCDCNTGLVTFDGATTGEVPYATVIKADACITFTDGIQTCHLNEAQRSGYTLCQGGDSGGPVYQRTSNNQVYPTGTIVGTNGAGDICTYQRIREILRVTGGTITGG